MLEEIKQRLDKAQENPLMGQYRIDVGFLLQELEKLQQENERYKEALTEIKKDIPIDADNHVVLMGKAAIEINRMRKLAENVLNEIP